MIADIEQYRAAHGRYPASLLSVWEDYLPGVIGIKEYHYEPSGDAYNLFFEQFALHFGTREFVMYNPRDQQAMTSHKLDLLQLTPQELALEQTRGHYAVHDAAASALEILLVRLTLARSGMRSGCSHKDWRTKCFKTCVTAHEC